MNLPPEVLAVFQNFRTCEFATIAKDGTPLAWPTAARWLPAEEKFLITTSIGFPQKAFNIRRNPKVSLLFSNPTASGLTQPAAVSVQGDAVAPDEIVTDFNRFADYWRETIFARQPASEIYGSNALLRSLTDWYYMRLIIHITPRTIRWWPAGDFSRPALSVL